MGNLREITGLRGLAAVAVVGFHALFLYPIVSGHWPQGRLADALSHGWIGVDFFFVLSGFLLSLSLLRAPSRALELSFWREYLGKRWFRIAPPYFVSIFLSLLAVGQLSYLVTHKTDVLLHLFYLHNFAPGSLMSINWVYWSLAVEFQFYLVLPFFALLFVRRTAPLALAACLAISVAWRAAFFVPGDLAQNFWLANQLPGFLGHFALGVMVAKTYLHEGPGPLWRRYSVPGVAITFTAVPLAAFSHGMGSLPMGWFETAISGAILRPALGVGFAALLLVVLQGAPALRSALGAAPLRFLGEMSYSVYLVHLPVGVVLVLWTPMPTSLWAFAAWLTAATLAASAVFYLLVERPSLRLKEILTRGPAPRDGPGVPEPSAVASVVHAPGPLSPTPAPLST